MDLFYGMGVGQILGGIESKMENNNSIGQGLATIGLAIICSMWAYLTQGTSGIGWFIFGLVLIWM